MAYEISLHTAVDPRGTLTVCEDVLPFDIQRVFFIYEVHAPRGDHRQKATTQALVAMHGTVDVMCDADGETSEFRLSSPQQCLVIPPGDWRMMHFHDDAVLLVMSSHKYDPTDTVWER